MNYKTFAKKWLELHGLFDADSDYDGALGDAVMELVKTFSDQHHSGASASMTAEMFYQIHKDYSDGHSQIWQDYWNSDEGRKLLAEHDMKPEDMMKK